MLRSEESVKTGLRNAVAVVATPVLPGAVVGLPASCPMLLPGAPLRALLLLRVPALPRSALLLAVLALPLLLGALLAALALALLLLGVRLFILSPPRLLGVLLIVLASALLLLALLLLRMLLFGFGLFVAALLMATLLLMVLLFTLLLLLRIGRSGGSEQQRQDGRAGDSDDFHKCLPRCYCSGCLLYRRLLVVTMTELPMASPEDQKFDSLVLLPSGGAP